MGKKRIASAYIFGEQYKKLRGTEMLLELTNRSAVAFSLSANIDDYCKLTAKQVYDKILDSTFFIAPPEKTKTTRTIVSKC